MSADTHVTVGSYIASRLAEASVRHYFAVPGDYNLILLDEFLKNGDLRMISCCNELNAGYAADGYARANGVSAQVVTFSVGGLSALNAIAGAYAEDLSVLIISGGPNTNSEMENRILHHTCGEVHYGYQRDIFSHTTVMSVIVRHLEDAPYLIDKAIEECVFRKKPVYLEIPCNLAGLKVPPPKRKYFVKDPVSHPEALEEAVEKAAELLGSAAKTVLVAGAKLRPFGAVGAFRNLVDASRYAVASMPEAKGIVPEDHPGYIGTYWGPVSSPGTAEIVESANMYLFAGPVFTDYTTCGFSSLIKPEKLIHAGPDFVRLPGVTYSDIAL
ncbi:MAG: pyruvate decarboxylase, partial [Candidatus Dadabacteria bacterium]|nr:pyruvate decarboxylase [Candidatus Dadabacteria bacterium]